MDTLTAIMKRRSIRAYTDKKISAADIKTLLRAAMMAPTARNAQEWEFIVVRDKNTFKKIVRVLPNGAMLEGADCAIIVCADKNKELSPGYWIGDCGAAAQNILLAATELGIASVGLGVQPKEERRAGIKKFFALPDNIEPFCVVSLGYPAESKYAPDRYDEAKVHYEKW